MNLQNFIIECKLPPDWEPIVRMEALTGCSVCERRLLHNGYLRGGTAVTRFYKKNVLDGVLVLCKECAPK
jgi:hypothetical protein